MFLIGIGAAGNKVLTAAKEKKIIDDSHLLYLNSTEKDFPDQESPSCIIIENTGGCGKERSIGKEIMQDFLKNAANIRRIEAAVPDDVTHVFIVASMGGGTGSGGATVLADYFKSRQYDVTLIGIKGFKEDLRELRNTIEFFKDINPDITVQLIDNTKYMKACKDNKVAAEAAANNDIVNYLGLLQGRVFKKSDQNIDAADLEKLATMPGYQQIYTGIVPEDLNSREDMEELVRVILDTSKFIPTEPSATNIGVFLNLPKKQVGFFDFEYTQIKENLGEPYEVYLHIQDAEETGMRGTVIIIASGMKLPIKELEEMSYEYNQKFQTVNDGHDEFFEVREEAAVGKTRFDRGGHHRRAKRPTNLVDTNPIESNGKLEVE